MVSKVTKLFDALEENCSVHCEQTSSRMVLEGVEHSASLMHWDCSVSVYQCVPVLGIHRVVPVVADGGSLYVVVVDW